MLIRKTASLYFEEFFLVSAFDFYAVAPRRNMKYLCLFAYVNSAEVYTWYFLTNSESLSHLFLGRAAHFLPRNGTNT